jgi:serine/threonine-protein kinase
MAASYHVDRDAFLANVRRSRLLTDEQLARTVGGLPATRRGRPVARAMVESGLLTRFQASQLLVGRTNGFFLGQYRVLDHIGSGGMGRVFKAEHGTLNRIVAIKVLAPRLLRTARAHELFLREVRAAARLLHPNIVTAFDANHEGRRTYLVMEHVDGPNLHQLVRRQGPLLVGQACEYVRQTAQGLHYAHQKGMVHRDVKPGNLLLQTEWLVGPAGQQVLTPTVKISDFGLACLNEPGGKSGGENDRRNVLMGTPDYVAPEQARDNSLADPRCDLYSLGCSFFHLLTGRVPFAGGHAREKVARQATEVPPAVEQLRPDVPPAVGAIVRRLMAKRPEERFATAGELIAVLAPFCGAASSAPVGPSTPPFIDVLATPEDDAASATTAGPTRLPFSAESPATGRRPWAQEALLIGTAAAAMLAAGAVGWLLASR